jgi:hypothetical protein
MNTNMSSMVSGKSGLSAKYIVITELPTYFRQYDFDKVFVRGLYFEEAKALSKLVDAYGKEIPLNKLALLYEDVIRMETGTLYDLEISDFFALQTISTLNTVEGFGWIPNQPCRQFHEGRMCDGNITAKIELADLDFTEPTATSLPLSIKFQKEEYNLGAVTIANLIEIEALPKDQSEYAVYAHMVKGSDKSIPELINMIKYCDPKEGAMFEQMDSELFIGINPVKKRCSKCNQINEVRIGLNTIKSFP